VYVKPFKSQQDNEVSENKTRSKDKMDTDRIVFKTFLTAHQLILVSFI